MSKELEQLILSKSRPVQKEVKQLQKSELDRLIIEALLGEQDDGEELVIPNIYSAEQKQAIQQIFPKIKEKFPNATIDATKSNSARIAVTNTGGRESRHKAIEELFPNHPADKFITSDKEKKKKTGVEGATELGGLNFLFRQGTAEKVSATFMEKALAYYMSGDRKAFGNEVEEKLKDPALAAELTPAADTITNLSKSNSEFKKLVKNFKSAEIPELGVDPDTGEKGTLGEAYSKEFIEFRKVSLQSDAYQGQKIAWGREAKTDLIIKSDKTYDISIKKGDGDTQLLSFQGPAAGFLLWVGLEASRQKLDMSEGKLDHEIEKAKQKQIQILSNMFSKKAYADAGGDISFINRLLRQVVSLGKDIEKEANELLNETFVAFQDEVSKIDENGKKAIIREAATGSRLFEGREDLVADWMLKWSSNESLSAFMSMDEFLAKIEKVRAANLNLRVSRRSADKYRLRIDSKQAEELKDAISDSQAAAQESAQAITEILNEQQLNELSWGDIKNFFGGLVQTIQKILQILKKIWESLKEQIKKVYNTLKDALSSEENFAKSQEYFTYGFENLIV